MFNPQLGMNGGFDPNMIMNPHLMQACVFNHCTLNALTNLAMHVVNVLFAIQGMGMPPIGNMQGETQPQHLLTVQHASLLHALMSVMTPSGTASAQPLLDCMQPCLVQQYCGLTLCNAIC